MEKMVVYIGEGGDAFASEVIEEIMEFADGQKIAIKPLQDFSPDEIEDYEEFEGCEELYVVVVKD